jgi:cytochrome b561
LREAILEHHQRRWPKWAPTKDGQRQNGRYDACPSQAGSSKEHGQNAGQAEERDKIGREQEKLDELGDDEKHQTLARASDNRRASPVREKPRLRWHFGIRLLHWLTVAALATQIAIALGPMNGPGMATMYWLPLHMSIGVTILAIIVLRLCWRIFTQPPVRQPSRSVRIATAFFHMFLYVMILAVLLTGWLGYRPMPFMPPARLFGYLHLPLAPSVGGLSARAFAFVHAKLVWILLGFVGVHILGALVHFLVLRDGVMRTMYFGRPDIASRQEQALLAVGDEAGCSRERP